MPAQLMIGTGGGNLADVSGRAGAAWRVPRIARGLAAGDLDNDGRTDLLIVSQNCAAGLLSQPVRRGHWLTLQLEGTASHRDAVGARVTITAGGRRRTDWRIGGGSYQSACDPRLHFGLGTANSCDQIEVTWPSGRVDRFGPLGADTAYLLRRGNCDAQATARLQESVTGPCRRSQGIIGAASLTGRPRARGAGTAFGRVTARERQVGAT